MTGHFHHYSPLITRAQLIMERRDMGRELGINNTPTHGNHSAHHRWVIAS